MLEDAGKPIAEITARTTQQCQNQIIDKGR